MEFVKIILYVAVITQTYAAPHGDGVSYTTHNNEFDVPEIARKGFVMTVEAAIDDKFKNKPLNVLLKPDNPSDFCKSENVKGMHICIVPMMDGLINKSGNLPQPSTVKLSIKATVSPNDAEELTLEGFLNENHKLEETTTFEELKHIMVEGVIGEIKNLHFDFSESARLG